MAGWIDFYDIESRMQHFAFSSSSKPSITDVESFIDAVEAEMDARMQAVGIDVDNIDSSKTLMLERIAVNGVIADVLQSVNIEDEDVDRYHGYYEDAMQRIESRPGIIELAWETYTAVETNDRETPPFRREARIW